MLPGEQDPRTSPEPRPPSLVLAGLGLGHTQGDPSSRPAVARSPPPARPSAVGKAPSSQGQGPGPPVTAPSRRNLRTDKD